MCSLRQWTSMSSRNELLYLGHMLDHARRAYAKASAVTREQFFENEETHVFVTHFIQIVGEAAGRIPPEVTNAHPEIDWQRITGMRHKIVHDYFEVDLAVVWDVARNDLPFLIAALEKITPPEPPSA